MQNRPPDNLKSTATELAALLYENSSDNERIKTLLSQLSYPGEQTQVQEQASVPVPAEEDRIGIWQLVHKNGKTYYERDIRLKGKWSLWAQIHQIRLKGTKKRVVLLGESVARGYFYDPYYTVANELEGVLGQIGKPSEVEVIDLARTSTHMEEMLGTAQASVKLEPDAVVVFAGNNWIASLSYALCREDYATMYTLLQQGHLLEMQLFLEGKFAGLIASFMQRLHHIYAVLNIPVVFVVPPFNLKDWKSDETEKILPWLPGDRIVEWLEAERQAGEALRKKQYSMLEHAARIMVNADPTNPLGYEYLAESYLINKDWKDAIRCFEQARDTGLISRGNNSKPRCLRIAVETVCTEAAKWGMQLVDLSEIFNHLPGIPVPDRSLFLDYCHLTVEGIKIAMKHTARMVATVLWDQHLAVEAMPGSGIEPDDEVKGIAHFCAAIHNAHYGQPADILAYHCRMALSLSQEVKEIMAGYIDFSTRYAATDICRSFEEIIMQGAMRQYESGLALLHPRDGKLMDVALIDAIVHEMQAAGSDMKRRVHDLRKKEHGIRTERLDLLESFYSRTGYNSFPAQPVPCFLQARSINSVFNFVAGNGSPIAFEIVLRTPGRAYEGKMIRILINGSNQAMAVLPMSRQWEKYSFAIEKEQLHDGVNHLCIEWPYTPEPLSVMPDISRHSFLQAAFPVIGEIFSFTAHALVAGNGIVVNEIDEHFALNK